jgi:hypothetical protein
MWTTGRVGSWLSRLGKKGELAIGTQRQYTGTTTQPNMRIESASATLLSFRRKGTRS